MTMQQMIGGHFQDVHRFIFKMRDGRSLGVWAKDWKDAETLVKAFCVLKGAPAQIERLIQEADLGKGDFNAQWEEAKQFSLRIHG
jgi:hypothetical protein